MLLENNKILLNGCVLSASFSGEEEGGQIDKKERISSFFFGEESSILRMKLIQERLKSPNGYPQIPISRKQI